MRVMGCRIIVLAAVIASACAQHADSELPSPREISRISAITVSSPEFSIAAGTSFSWRSEILWHQGDSVPGPSLLTRRDVQLAIETELARKGARFAEADEAPDYSIVAAILMGESDRATELQDIIQIHPSLRPISQTLEKGTLLIAISHPGSTDLLWRGAVQVFLVEGLTRRESEIRLESAVRNLFLRFPRQR